MKKILFSILCAFMVSTVASAQYVNVKLKDGTYSFKTSSDMEVSFGEKKGTEVAESAQTVTINGHTVAVKLADDTPASEVMLSTYVEEEKVKIEAFSKLNHGLWCSMDAETSSSNGFYTFTLSDISKDLVVTVGYINVSFDLNNSGMNGNFTAKPADITKIGYNATIKEPDRLFSDKYGFRGWCKDKECTTPWNYSHDKVTKSITLYAKWAEDPAGTQINEHDFVKLGGYYWATGNVDKCNVTAVAGPEAGDNGWGFYFYKQSNNAAFYAARSFGGTWTLPSEAQWQALIDYCDWEWKTGYEYNGKIMNGMLVKGRADTYESGHSIFLPAAGNYFGSVSYVIKQGNDGYYWSASGERCLSFYDGVHRMNSNDLDHGLAVRPVSE